MMDTSFSPLRIAVLISGSGSNLQALIDACEAGIIPGRIVLVISNNPQAFGIERAKQHQIATQVVDHRLYADRESFDREMIRLLDQHDTQLVCLAGFMRVLSNHFTHHYANRLINIHPALLPAFPGLHVQQRAIEAGVRFSGATVHFVVPEVDAGPIIVQAVVPVLADDTPDTLAARILRQEHRIYPLAVRWFAEERLQITGNQVRLLYASEDEQAALIHPLGA